MTSVISSSSYVTSTQITFLHYNADYAASALALLVWQSCKKLSDEVLEWLSLRSKVQMICIWASHCHCHPTISCFIKIQIGLTYLVPAYPAVQAINWVSVCLYLAISGQSKIEEVGELY